MLEIQILDTIDKISAHTLSNEERSIMVAEIKNELSNKRFASSNNIIHIAMEKINELKRGEFKEAQISSNTFQDFSESNQSNTPFKTINQEEIDKFLDKMSSEENEDVFFNDTWGFYHPTENMKAEGLPRHRSDFNVKS